MEFQITLFPVHTGPQRSGLCVQETHVHIQSGLVESLGADPSDFSVGTSKTQRLIAFVYIQVSEPEKTPGEGNGNPLQCSCLENFMD